MRAWRSDGLVKELIWPEWKPTANTKSFGMFIGPWAEKEHGPLTQDLHLRVEGAPTSTQQSSLSLLHTVNNSQEVEDSRATRTGRNSDMILRAVTIQFLLERINSYPELDIWGLTRSAGLFRREFFLPRLALAAAKRRCPSSLLSSITKSPSSTVGGAEDRGEE